MRMPASASPTNRCSAIWRRRDSRGGSSNGSRAASSPARPTRGRSSHRGTAPIVARPSGGTAGPLPGTALLGVPGAALARRLGFLSALRGPPWYLPDPDLSGHVHRLLRPVADALMGPGGLRAARALMPCPDFFAACGELLKAAGGRPSIPRCLAPP